MDPKPVIGIIPNVLFDDLIKKLCVFFNIQPFIACLDERDLGFDYHSVSPVGLTKVKNRDNRGRVTVAVESGTYRFEVPGVEFEVPGVVEEKE